MRIFFPNIHRRLPKSLAKAVEKVNYTILIPDETFKNIINYGQYYSYNEFIKDPYMLGCNNIKLISYQEFMDNPPDVITVNCYEVEKDIITKLWTKIDKNKSKLVYYNGNNNFYSNWEFANNIFTTDVITAKKAKIKNKNFIIWLPWVDFDDEFSFNKTNNNNIFNSYISMYKQLFLNDYNYSVNIKNMLANENIIFSNYESIEFNAVGELMNNSCGTIHIKFLEGYGYSIIESMGRGRMVFLYRPHSQDKTYTNWCIEDKTCFYFDDEVELLQKIKKYKENYENYQTNCAINIRKLIDNERQSDRLIQFFNTLRD